MSLKKNLFSQAIRSNFYLFKRFPETAYNCQEINQPEHNYMIYFYISFTFLCAAEITILEKFYVYRWRTPLLYWTLIFQMLIIAFKQIEYLPSYQLQGGIRYTHALIGLTIIYFAIAMLINYCILLPVMTFLPWKW